MRLARASQLGVHGCLGGVPPSTPPAPSPARPRTAGGRGGRGADSRHHTHLAPAGAPPPPRRLPSLPPASLPHQWGTGGAPPPPPAAADPPHGSPRRGRCVQIERGPSDRADAPPHVQLRHDMMYSTLQHSLKHFRRSSGQYGESPQRRGLAVPSLPSPLSADTVLHSITSAHRNPVHEY